MWGRQTAYSFFTFRVKFQNRFRPEWLYLHVARIIVQSIPFVAADDKRLRHNQFESVEALNAPPFLPDHYTAVLGILATPAHHFRVLAKLHLVGLNTVLNFST